LGYSLNMLSLLGALMALGMLVDEAIVVAENIYRHLEKSAWLDNPFFLHKSYPFTEKELS